MRKVLSSSLVLLAILASVPGMAANPAVNFLEDWINGNDAGWVRSDTTPYYSVVGPQYQIYNYGAQTTYSTRPDLPLPSSWTFSVDIATYEPGTWPGNRGYGGIALVQDSANPGNNSILVDVVYSDTQDAIALQISRGDAADITSFIPYNQGDNIHLVVTRPPGSNQLTATLTAPGGTLSLTNTVDLTSKLAVCKTPGLQVGGGVSAFYQFSTVRISSVARTTPVFKDDFSSGNDSGWVRSAAAPVYSVTGGQYVINNSGTADAYSTRPDVTLPSNWQFDADVKAYRPNLGVEAIGGLALVADSSNPGQNYIHVNVCVNDTQNEVGLQIDWQTGATSISGSANWLAYSQGSPVHLTVHVLGSNGLLAVLTTPDGTVTHLITTDEPGAAVDLTSKLAACKIPGVFVGGGGDFTYQFANVSIISQTGLTDDYLSVDGQKGLYKYADGYGDDNIITFHGGTYAGLLGALHYEGDRYYKDVVALGSWWRRRNPDMTELGAFSSDANNAVIYKISLPDEGAPGYIIDHGEILFGTRLYDGFASIYVSNDGVNWSPSLQTFQNTAKTWQWLDINIPIPAAYTGGDTIYVKMTGATPEANDFSSIEHWGIRLDLKAATQTSLIGHYLSLNGSTGTYKYATGFGADVNIPANTSIDFTGAINNDPDKYLADTASLDHWFRNDVRLAVFSKDPSNSAIYKFSMPSEGAPGYAISGGQIFLGTVIYEQNGEVSLAVSKDGVNWSAPLQTDQNKFTTWMTRYHDLTIPSAYTGGNTLYVKLTGSTPSGNDWASVNGLGVSLTLAQSTQAVSNIGDLAALSDGQLVSLTSPKVVTVASGTFTDGSSYIEEPGRASGIKITGAAGLSLGDNVAVTGTLGTDPDGQRSIAVTSIDSQTSGTALAALGMTNKTVAGSMATGLLVTVWGRVTYVASDGSYVYVDDGSGLTDGSGHTGVRIQLGGLTTPISTVFTGSPYAVITGVAGMVLDGSTPVRMIAPRGNSDVNVF